MKTITLKFELQQGNYKLITNDNMLQGFDFSADDLLNKEKAEDTQGKLEYIFYRKRNKGVVMTADEMFDIYIGEINDFLPYEYVEKVKNSLQYKEFVKELEKQENDFIDKLIEQSELDYNL